MTKNQESTFFSNAVQGWTQATGEFWRSFSETLRGASENFPKHAESMQQNVAQTMTANWDIFRKIMENLGDGMQKKNESGFDPADMSAQLEAVGRFMQVFQKQTDFIQKRFMENTEKLGEVFEVMDSAGTGSDLLHAWQEIYEKEIRKIFHIPQVGLGREYQERMMAALDRFSLFHGNAIELLHFLYIPMEQSFLQMQKDLEKMVAEGRIPDDQEEYYRLWLQKLESHYMELFRSPEYTSVLGKTLAAMGEFKSAKDAIIEDSLQSFPIPTRSEMDELYKEIYALKRRIRELEKARHPQA
ncbi:poly(R)-hydroxyalkanoic acid synthase subunit PhaE [Desulfobotulus sp.]|jgi:class III poly(R)-hydroxyalkanoic acid synthase PhaE subunit|uniref:poly(R)-hydroxyalkanoic acid synthase subunit PhaE n=1 Tax=Desulfobotulus sp. TaxID=1940337 RepID=UPI002A3714A7|nr:poly(R)-hydroxyalkanoic acid synthase subunit PhaE [Desulfobotulus sp.]MDY0161743.1 poly(R)-hydroxyalkanoic acid synthase subunit PhaE [Desulfobotulus sp.]